MNHTTRSLTLFTSAFFLGIALLSAGCCGPMWRPGACGTGAYGTSACGYGTSACGSACGDGCGPCGGCGELYIDPWINEPADCCDPCDSCGNFNGQSCGKCRSVFAGVKSLWGYKCDDGYGCDSGSCGGSCGGCDSGSCGGCDSGSCGGDCGCGSSHEDGIYHSYSGGEVIGDGMVSDGESIIETGPVGSGANPRIISQPRVARERGASRSIFQPRRVDGPKKPLAY